MNKHIDKTILVTGGCGFIGSHFIAHILDNYYDVAIINVDKLTYASNTRVTEIVNDKYTFVKLDIAENDSLEETFSPKQWGSKIDLVVNFAAETHVDNSIHMSRTPFILSNILGTEKVSTFCSKHDIRLLHISTDEVYGSLNYGSFKESDALNPTNPYSASKAAAEHIVKSFGNTFNLDFNIVRPSNNYGPGQHSEKFIPTIINNALSDEKIPVYALGQNTRQWTYVTDCVEAIDQVRLFGTAGEIYNIGSEIEIDNLGLVKMILDKLDKRKSLIRHVSDRPGHDFRYAIDTTKIRELGWLPKNNLITGLERTLSYHMNKNQ